MAGPIPSQGKPGDSTRNYIFYSTPMDLTKAGYIEQEYFISGNATRYSIPATSADATSIGVIPYQTRIVVRRPASGTRFSGVVVVDWQNVTAGHDVDTEWSQAAEFFVRSGWAWIGASVQRVSVHGFDPPNPSAGRGLKQWSPSRYGSLDLTNRGAVTDDSQSYDIYSQIGKMLKSPPRGANPLDGLKVQRVYAGGISQSAVFLVRYYNSVQRLASVYDGFLIGLAGGAPRLDLPTKLFKVATETDVWRGQAAVRVPDTDSTHSWEIAGASHVGSYLMSTDQSDFRSILGGILDRDIRPEVRLRDSQCLRAYAAEVESWSVYSAAYAALDRWVTTNIKPRSVEPIRVSAAPPAPQFASIVRDHDGFALGGIRLPRVAVPTALNTGENQAINSSNPLGAFCNLYGTHQAFDPTRLKGRYPSRDAYTREVRRIVEDLVRAGFVLEADAPRLIRNAENDLGA